MIKKLAAEAVLLAHFLFVAFAVLGAFLALIDVRWVWLHVPAVIWSSVVNAAAWTCPLTPLEQQLRARSGQTAYEGGFIHHYIGPLVYPGGMPRRLERVAAVSIVVWNAIAYTVVWLLMR